MAKGFKIQDGPFVRTLDTALKSFNVHREAYYGGTFVGNHVHRTLKVNKYTNKNTINCTLYYTVGREHTMAL